MRTNNLFPALLPLLLSTTPTPASAAKAKPKDAILLSEVQSLTLRANKQTNHRRVSAIPQLKCISDPKICALHTIDVMRCTNQGSSYTSEDIEWSCTASLPPELKLGSTDVICEGYSSPEDPYILRGSCGVEYRLVLTELGEQRFPEIANANANAGSFGGWFSGWGKGAKSSNREPLHNFDDYGREQSSKIGAWLFSALFLGVLFWIIYSAWTQATAPAGAGPRRRPRNGWFGGGGGGFDPGWGPGGGGGGGGYGDYDPPPPYDKYGSSSQQGGWRPGFWSGVASTAAASYLYNNMAGNRGDRRQESRNFYGGSSGGSSRGWGSSAAGPSSSSWGSSFSSPSTSSSRYTSTGFGSTNRR